MDINKNLLDTISKYKRFTDHKPLILTPTDIGQDYLLHISRDKLEDSNLYPFISRRIAKGEDNTIPRVSTSEHLLGCISGYQSMQSLSSDLSLKTENDKFFYRGGFAIHAIDFDYCIKPNSTLLPDVEYTDERWLITYDTNTISYPSKVIGKIFVDYIVNEPMGKLDTLQLTYLYLAIENIDKLQINRTISLDKGYYKLVLVNDKFLRVSLSKTNSIKSISKEEYDTVKGVKANLLSNTSSLNNLSFSKW